MAKEKIKITAAKGRPMLNWVGKKPLDYVKGFPAQLVERFDPMEQGQIVEKPTFDALKDNWQNLLFHGDNKEVLATLLANGFRGQIDLIYIDPPFDSAANYVRKVQLRGMEQKMEGEKYALGEQVQYFDIWANDNYLQFMYERLLLLKELLSEEGSIYLHCDYRKSHVLRNIMDEVFGPEKLRNEIIWFYPRGGDSEKQFNRKHDTILFYSKGENWLFNYRDVIIPYTEEQIERFEEEDEDGKFYWNINPRGERCKTYYKDGIGEYDVWNIGINASQIKELGYPTLKPEALLERIIKASSKRKDIVLDCFLGGGTAVAVAQKLGRRWIGVDINKGAIQTTSKRLQKIILEQAEQINKESRQKKLIEEKDLPKYLSFSHYKVNDYDLQILRTEAIELAIEHIGIQRTKTDGFFDGTLGKNLVKIIDFNHPFTLLDLQLIQDELKKRPDENRDITVVCLGKELAIDPEIETYNKKHPVNKIKVIELRTDEKYGKFIIYKPASAKLKIKRKGQKAVIEIEDFISPSIIERLSNSENLVKVKIPDFRSMIDVVLIDSDYNEKVFNIKFTDVPEKKNDFVQGKYEIEIPKNKTTVAVKIIDMLGEEVLITKTI
jgi:DNA modification methylase